MLDLLVGPLVVQVVPDLHPNVVAGKDPEIVDLSSGFHMCV